MSVLPCLLASAVLAAGDGGVYPRGHEREGLPASAGSRAMYAADPEHALNRLHTLLFVSERRPTEIGASLPAERARQGLDDAAFFEGKWYFQSRKGESITDADIRLFGGDVRVSPVEDLRGERGAQLRQLLSQLDTREEVEAIPELHAPLARLMLQWDLTFVWWRIERVAAEGGTPAADPETLVALASAIRALALPRAVLEALDSGASALAPTGNPGDRTRAYLPAGLFGGAADDPWREVARDEKALFHATNSLRAARVFVRAGDGEATERLIARSAAVTDAASTPVLELGIEAALVMSLVVLDDTLAPMATHVIDEVRVRRVSGPAELRPDNGSSRDGWSHWIHLRTRRGSVLGSEPVFRFVPDTAQGLFLEYGSPKYTTYFAQCALCHRRTNSGGQDPDGIRALGRYGKPSVERDPVSRSRMAERQFEPIAAALRGRLEGAQAR